MSLIPIKIENKALVLVQGVLAGLLPTVFKKVPTWDVTGGMLDETKVESITAPDTA